MWWCEKTADASGASGRQLRTLWNTFSASCCVPVSSITRPSPVSSVLMLAADFM